MEKKTNKQTVVYQKAHLHQNAVLTVLRQAAPQGGVVTAEAAQEAAAGWGQDSAMQLLIGHMFDQHSRGAMCCLSGTAAGLRR